MSLSSEAGLRQEEGLHSAPRPPFVRRTWSIFVGLWLTLVLGLFLGIRILNSETVTHLLRKFAAR